MVISVVTETYWPDINGVAMTLHRLVKGLTELGHEVQLVCPQNKDRNITELPKGVAYRSARGLPIPGYGEANFGIPAPRLFRKLWSTARPDVIYVATEGPLGWSAVNEARKLGLRIVSGFHTNFHSYSQHYKLGFMEKLVERYLVTLHNKTHTTVVPTQAQRSMLEDMGVKNVAVMGRGVDTTLFTPAKRSLALRKQWGVENNDPVMIYVGRLAEEKNLDLTIKSYYSMRQLNNKTRFVLVGDGPLKGRLKKEHPEFIIAGMQNSEALAEHYASGDIFVFTSLTETFGNVVLEAMASGLGVVAFDYAAAHLHIKPSDNGLLVDRKDPMMFLKHSESLVQNDVLLKKLRLNARKAALQHSWENIVTQFEAILHLHIDKETRLTQLPKVKQLTG